MTTGIEQVVRGTFVKGDKLLPGSAADSCYINRGVSELKVRDGPPRLVAP